MWQELAKWSCFETERLRLRPFVYQDADDFFAIMSDEENTTFLHPTVTSQSLCQRFLVEAFMRKPLGIWAIEDKKTGQMIGSIRLENIQQQARQAEVGYFLHRAFWRQGFGTEVLESLLFLAFRQLGLQQLTIKTHLENKASQALAQKLGFCLIGQYKGSDRHSRQMRFFKDFALTKQDYHAMMTKNEGVRSDYHKIKTGN